MSDDVSTVDRVDPRAPRFGQAVTATLLFAAVTLHGSLLVYATTAILATAVLSGWKLDPYGLVWKHLLVPVVGEPSETETAAPHRFAKLLGATGTTFATLALVAGFPVAGFAVAGAVAAAAGLAATTGLCLGCKLYGQVRFFQRVGVV